MVLLAGGTFKALWGRLPPGLWEWNFGVLDPKVGHCEQGDLGPLSGGKNGVTRGPQG